MSFIHGELTTIRHENKSLNTKLRTKIMQAFCIDKY